MGDDPGEVGATASPDEVWAAADALSSEELTRLQGVGRRLAYGIRGLGGADILMEAIERSLRGSSKWRRGVPFDVFLFGVMRNVAKQWRDLKASTVRTVHVVGHGQQNEHEVNLRSATPNAEQVLLDREAEAETRETARRIHELFKDDVEIEAVIYGIENDLSASEVQEAFGITATQYASARRRMSRALDKEFPGRRESRPGQT